jgi:RNA repair pathway DNA polymerase beta family
VKGFAARSDRWLRSLGKVASGEFSQTPRREHFSLRYTGSDDPRRTTRAQVRRLQGIGTGKKGHRHELIGVHGYDIKAAMHAIRLLGEGIELMRSGTITLPRPERELLITIRTGKCGSLEHVLSLANTLLRELEEAEAKSGLPQKVDRARISELVSPTYLRFWNNSPAMLGPRRP